MAGADERKVVEMRNGKRKIKSTGDNSALQRQMPRGENGGMGMGPQGSSMQSIEMQVQVQVKSGAKAKGNCARQIGSANYKMVASLNSDKQESRERTQRREGEAMAEWQCK